MRVLGLVLVHGLVLRLASCLGGSRREEAGYGIEQVGAAGYRNAAARIAARRLVRDACDGPGSVFVGLLYLPPSVRRHSETEPQRVDLLVLQRATIRKAEKQGALDVVIFLYL